MIKERCKINHIYSCLYDVIKKLRESINSATIITHSHACAPAVTILLLLPDLLPLPPYPSSMLDFNERLINKKVDPNWILAATTTTTSFVVLKISL